MRTQDLESHDALRETLLEVLRKTTDGRKTPLAAISEVSCQRRLFILVFHSTHVFPGLSYLHPEPRAREQINGLSIPRPSRTITAQQRDPSTEVRRTQ